MPEGAAQHRLEALTARFHDVQTHDPDRSATASTLLTFLPQRAPPASVLPQAMSAGLAQPRQGFLFDWIVAAALFLGWVAMLAQGQ